MQAFTAEPSRNVFFAPRTALGGVSPRGGSRRSRRMLRDKHVENSKAAKYLGA